MIHKIMDHKHVTHHNVLGFAHLVPLCGATQWAATEYDLSPASWRREVDCMTCLVRAARLIWCGHGNGMTIRIDPVCKRMFRWCHRCAGTV